MRNHRALLLLWRFLATAAKKRSRRQNEVFCSATRDIEGMISIEALGPEEWKVTVTGAARTEHRVRVRAAVMEHQAFSHQLSVVLLSGFSPRQAVEIQWRALWNRLELYRGNGSRLGDLGSLDSLDDDGGLLCSIFASASSAWSSKKSEMKGPDCCGNLGARAKR